MSACTMAMVMIYPAVLDGQDMLPGGHQAAGTEQSMRLLCTTRTCAPASL